MRRDSMQDAQTHREDCPKSPHVDRGKPRVFMMDLLSAVPYYTGHLCMALREEDSVAVEVGAITYHLDRSYFAAQGLRLQPGCSDVASRLGPSCPVPVRKALKLFEYLVNLCALAARFTWSKPAIVHVQFLPLVKAGLPFELWFLWFVRRLGAKVVHTAYNLLPHDSGGRHFECYRRVYRNADHLICHDESARRSLIEHFGIKAEKVSVIPHGPLFAPVKALDRLAARRSLGVDEHAPIVLWQGILRPYKGVATLIGAWESVVTKRGRAVGKLVVIGPGEGACARQIENRFGSCASLNR